MINSGRVKLHLIFILSIERFDVVSLKYLSKNKGTRRKNNKAVMEANNGIMYSLIEHV